MKNMGIKRLNWDSEFFGFEVGEILNTAYIGESNNYSLIILKQNEDNDVQIDNFEKRFQETKVIFEKKISFNNLIISTDFIFDFDNLPICKTMLYPLAFESGKYSRFKLDVNFTQKNFELLYCKWVDNSINKQFADKIYYVKVFDEVIGFVTVKLSKKFATIGLIGISKNYQGKGIGKILLCKVEEYCVNNSILELRIPTQKENVLACAFYNKNGYQIIEKTIIKHYWRNINDLLIKKMKK